MTSRSNIVIYSKCSEPRVDPSIVTTYIGGTTTFRCTNFSTGKSFLRWSQSIGSSIPDIVYTEKFGVKPNYKERYHVALDKDGGNSSLVIRKISGSDAGTYRCETDEWGANADLVVIGEFHGWLIAIVLILKIISMILSIDYFPN